jgi:DNA-binding SARP family transcriptional activator
VLDFRILGPREVMSDEGLLDLGGRDQRLLLARLLLAPGRPVSIERLSDALSGGRDAKRVRLCISKLQRTLGADVLEEGRRGCRLRIRSGQIDVDRFRVLIEAADHGPPAAGVQNLRHALALWRGPVFGELGDVPFAQDFIAQLDELREAAQARLARQLR